MKRTDVATAVKGFLMGAANVVPGVSGGTIALITGIYSEIIEALNSLMVPSTWKALFHGQLRTFWQCIHGRFLLALAIGVVASIFSLAKLMEYTLLHHPIQTWALFFGLIIASAVLMFRGIRQWKLRDVLFALLGAGLGLLVCTLSPTRTPDAGWFIFICGAVAVCTMILPGVSGSFILVLFSKYDYIMSAISQLNVSVLLVFALGCVVGILAFSKFLHWLLARFERQTMLVLLGFVLGSLVKVWPWSNPEAIRASQCLSADVPYDPQILSAALWCLLGAALVLGVDALGRRKNSHEA